MGRLDTDTTHAGVDAESASSSSFEQPELKPRSWKSYVWDTWDLPKKERWLLFKVDAYVLTFASVGLIISTGLVHFANHAPQIGYFLKNLDLYNVNNAFLSGMEEDLEMFGNQLVTATSIYTVGYVIGQIPSNLLLTRVSPRWVIPTVRPLLVLFGDYTYACLA